MASSWVERRPSKKGTRYRVRYKLGGRESRAKYGGSFGTMREARLRCQWIDGELAAMRVPDLSTLAGPKDAPTLSEVAEKWRASRVDVRQSTLVQHRVA